MAEIAKISSGITPLDGLIDSLYIGDNVVWYDDSGNLAGVFCLNFIRISRSEKRPLIWVTFDRSPKNLLDFLGPLANHPLLTVLDCFTWGKGGGSEIFMKFYEKESLRYNCRIVKMESPGNPDQVMDEIYRIHSALTGDVRFVFESITGMQQLWGGEDEILKFYMRSCPKLYELNTVAYWLMEKRAHSLRLRAHINRIAQVAIELSVKRGISSLTVLKAEKRSLEEQNKPYTYWVRELDVFLETEKRITGRVSIGSRLKEFRKRRGISQTELAKFVGVTSSSISQVESNQIFPSLPSLMKIADVLSVDVSSFFKEEIEQKDRVVFPLSEGVIIKTVHLSEQSITAKLLIPADLETRAEPYLIDILPQAALPAHFFIHKGEELGYLLSGTVQFKADNMIHTLNPGDVVYLTSQIPEQWINTGSETARLLWIKLK